jgi:dTMP kinase
MSLAFITFEGIDGCGKTTLASIVYEKLDGNAYMTHEPRYTREMTFKDPLAIAFAFIADRAEHMNELRKAMQDHRYILCDRYCDSTYAYQGVQIAERFGITTEEAISFLQEAHRMLLKPDLTFLVDLSPDEARNRKDEGFDHVFMQSVRDAYLFLAKKEKRIVVLDGRKSPGSLAEEVLSRIIQPSSSDL